MDLRFAQPTFVFINLFPQPLFSNKRYQHVKLSKIFNLFNYADKSRRTLEELKRELQTVNQLDMNNIVGGRKRNMERWNNGCGGVIPQ